MKKVIVLVISIIIGILVYKKNDEIVIPSDSIRIRVIANSNSINDLYKKKIIKDNIKNNLYKLLSNANSIESANDLVKDNINNIKDIVSKQTNDYEINYGLNYFPKKIYKGVVYPEGDYKSLVITIGSGLGDNWWCVLYPPLCLIEDNDTINDVDYRLFIQDILNN